MTSDISRSALRDFNQTKDLGFRVTGTPTEVWACKPSASPSPRTETADGTSGTKVCHAEESVPES